MKQLLYSVFTTLILFGIGKGIYDKGRNDGVKDMKKSFDMMSVGMEIQDRMNKESK